ncbi:ArdR protein [Alloalcanivorax mobilis]|uniref:ArdR protein n=1 Tax=Alloalcanivorax mobilis TaxID=2019569 RepID=UPI000C75896E|nr:ArdR protein [Alloalcanivorax mobilis]
MNKREFHEQGILIAEAALPYLLRRAGEWREAEGHNGGVVIFYGAEVAGWMDKLRDPQHWCPGCLAVTKFGGVWRAHGGDDHSGARQWVEVMPEQELDAQGVCDD